MDSDGSSSVESDKENPIDYLLNHLNNRNKEYVKRNSRLYYDYLKLNFDKLYEKALKKMQHSNHSNKYHSAKKWSSLLKSRYDNK